MITDDVRYILQIKITMWKANDADGPREVNSEKKSLVPLWSCEIKAIYRRLGVLHYWSNKIPFGVMSYNLFICKTVKLYWPIGQQLLMFILFLIPKDLVGWSLIGFPIHLDCIVLVKYINAHSKHINILKHSMKDQEWTNTWRSDQKWTNTVRRMDLIYQMIIQLHIW
jgi:hypothetical protein